MKKIFVFSEVFWSEDFMINDLAFKLALRWC